MKCHECGGSYQSIKGSLQKIDKFIGPFVVKDIEYLECGKCNDRLFDPNAAKKISEAREEAMYRALMKQDIGNFVTGKEVLDLLGFTRQALNQNQKIRQGLLFRLRFSGRIYYLRKSVELFIKTGDGRFPLISAEPKQEKMSESGKTIDLAEYLGGLQIYPEKYSQEKILDSIQVRMEINNSERGQTPVVDNWIVGAFTDSHSYAAQS